MLKLAQALWSRRHGGDPADLPPALDQLSDLVALATVADVVPLTDENRTLVRRGLRRLAEADRPGLRALMSSAGVDPARVRASDLSFRLAPRINAAGRLGDPKLALDLLLATSRAEAQPLAEQLEGRNRERQQVEDTILRAAAAEIARSGALERGDRILVAAGEGWHEGVIGIVASRLVERHSRPVVLIALDGERGKGSGRSVSAYDLHAGLAACSGHLERFGGHRAAAGLTIEAASVEPFAAALRAHAAEHLPPEAACAARSWMRSWRSARSHSSWRASWAASSPAATAIRESTCSSRERSSWASRAWARAASTCASSWPTPRRTAGRWPGVAAASPSHCTRVRVTTSSAASRSTTGAARWRRGSCCARSCRGPSGSPSRSHLLRGSAPPGLPRRPVTRCR